MGMLQRVVVMQTPMVESPLANMTAILEPKSRKQTPITDPNIKKLLEGSTLKKNHPEEENIIGISPRRHLGLRLLLQNTGGEASNTLIVSIRICGNDSTTSC